MKDFKISDYIKYKGNYSYSNPDFINFDEDLYRIEHLQTNGSNIRKIYGHYVESGMAYLFLKNDND